MLRNSIYKLILIQNSLLEVPFPKQPVFVLHHCSPNSYQTFFFKLMTINDLFRQPDAVSVKAMHFVSVVMLSVIYINPIVYFSDIASKLGKNIIVQNNLVFAIHRILLISLSCCSE